MGYIERSRLIPFPRAGGLGNIPGALGWVPPRVQIQGIPNPVSAPAPDRSTYRHVQVPKGPDGTRATLKLMAELAGEAARDPYFIEETRSIIAECGSKDYACETQAMLDYVKRNVTYREGTLGVLQWLQAPGWTWFVAGEGACADMSTLLAAMDLVDGKSVILRAVAVDRSMPDSYSHVYPIVSVNGEWLGQDAVGPGVLGWQPPLEEQFLPSMDEPV